jgi:hypothetical protein
LDRSTALVINHPSVIFDVQGDEAVIIDLTTGRYFRLDPPSTALWLRFAIPSSAESVLESCRTPGALRPRLDDIVADLIGRGLLRLPDGTESAPNGAAPPEPWEFRGFVLEEFTDLEDILGLDPIHEVDPEKGWPHAAPG